MSECSLLLVRIGTTYSYPADVYSLGILLFEIFEENMPDYDQARQTITMASYDFMVRTPALA